MIKTGLIVEGGGMKCAYGAGILDRFLEDKISYDYCIGVSAGAANAASFLAYQKKRNYRFYTIYSKDKAYMSMQNYLKDGQLFGLQYIYDTLSNSEGVDPLDYERMQKNPCQFEIVGTNAQTGKPVYFSKEQMKRDCYLQLMASCAIPVICKPVRIGDALYYDGGVADSIPIERTLKEGCQKIVVILSNPIDYVKQPEKYKSIYSKKLKNYPEIVHAIDQRHVVYQKQKEYVLQLEEEGKAFVFAPTEHMKLSTYRKDPQVEQQLYELGLSDYDQKKEQLKAFLEG